MATPGKQNNPMMLQQPHVAMKPNEHASLQARAQQSKLVTSSSNTSSEMAVHLASFDNLGFADTMAESVRAIVKIYPIFIDVC